MNIQEVPVQLVNQVLPLVEDYISSALDYSCGDYTLDEARVYLTTGAWSLIVAFDEPGQFKGAAAVQYFNRPRDRVAFIIALGGRLVTGHEYGQVLFDIFRANGATCVEAGARDSILRLWKKYGLELKYHIISTSL
jgi:hypothetical protein